MTKDEQLRWACQKIDTLQYNVDQLTEVVSEDHHILKNILKREINNTRMHKVMLWIFTASVAGNILTFALILKPWLEMGWYG